MNIIPPEMWLSLHNTDAQRLASDRRTHSPAFPARRRRSRARGPRLTRLLTSSKGQK